MRKGATTSQAEKLKIATAICEQYATNDFTIESCCKSNGVSYSTFHLWINEKDGEGNIGEVGATYQKAQQAKDNAYKSTLKQLARTALEKRVTGYDIEVEETTDELIRLPGGEETTVNRIRTKQTTRHISPDVRAIIFALTNTDGGNFTTATESEIDFSKLTEQEQEAILERLAAKVKKLDTQ